MPIEFVTSMPVALSLFACAMSPIVLLALSHAPLKVSGPGQRFVAATAVTWTAWFGAIVAIAPGWVDLLTGAMLLAAATVAGFTLWTLVAWGFTLSMLLSLNRAGRPLSLEEWSQAYANGRPLGTFARDRLGVLFGLGLAELRGDEVIMTPVRGRVVARVTSVLRNLFGLNR
jgi:hypothetical protein